MGNKSDEISEWSVVIRDRQIFYNPEASLPLQRGDIWIFRKDGSFAIGFISNRKTNEEPQTAMLILSFGAISTLIKALKYLTGEK